MEIALESKKVLELDVKSLEEFLVTKQKKKLRTVAANQVIKPTGDSDSKHLGLAHRSFGRKGVQGVPDSNFARKFWIRSR